ncbi:hypothetical protein F511_43036 [Dorcoceras hygrometricum]|uniref:Uncharacterized protein n=1 Tax=Dorcoceras hygrometricum TaxID=472368 RepID=A0A2Z7AHH5_9LAMI|nr:hypothetical protein F511_43036 [Dorcoceras hygrometricum]
MEKIKLDNLYFVSAVLGPRRKRKNEEVEPQWMRLVDDMDSFNTYPWGSEKAEAGYEVKLIWKPPHQWVCSAIADKKLMILDSHHSVDSDGKRLQNLIKPQALMVTHIFIAMCVQTDMATHWNIVRPT